jgi:ADP-ribosylglycohydrolase
MSALPVAVRYWEGASSLQRRTMLSLLGYAAGDAYGFQSEFMPRIEGAAPTAIGTKPGWPSGGVSDDTLLTRLTILALAANTSGEAASNFLTLLHAHVDQLRGLGPTTRSALGLPVKEHEIHEVGISNGGMMRTALCGIAFDNAKERREWISALTTPTHNQSIARDCALALAAAFGEFELPIRSAMLTEELDPKVRDRIENLDSWESPTEGVSNASLDTLAAVIQVVEGSQSLIDTYHRSVRLGGDTDTIAALSAGLYAIRNPHLEELLSIGWITEVDWSELADADSLVEILLSKRDSHE